MILEDVRKNKISSIIIVTIFILVIMIGVYAVCMYNGMGVYSIIIALIFSLVPALISYYNCDKMVLVLNGARPATKEQDQLLDTTLDGLCIATGERVIIVMGAVNVMKPRVSGTLNKYILCIA